MKKISLADYNPTEEEIRQMFEDGRDDYEARLEFIAKYSCWDTEKMQIAQLLFIRGDLEGARNAAESIEDEGYREDTIHWLNKWEAEAETPGLIVD